MLNAHHIRARLKAFLLSFMYSAFQNWFLYIFQSTSSQPSSTPGSQYPVQLVAKFTAFPAVSAPDPDRYSTPGGVGGNGYNSSRRTPLAVKSSPHKVPGSPDFRASGSRNISGAGSTGSGGSLVRNRCAQNLNIFRCFFHTGAQSLALQCERRVNCNVIMNFYC